MNSLVVLFVHVNEGKRTYSVDILALELRDQLVETLLVGLNADSGEDLLDVGARRGGVTADLEEEVCSNVTHLQRTNKDQDFSFTHTF